MLDFPRWKVWSISLTVLLGVLFAIPSLVPESQVAKWPSWLPSAQISLGLDLAGGSHLLLEADTSDVAKHRLAQMAEVLRVQLPPASPPVRLGGTSPRRRRLPFPA